MAGITAENSNMPWWAPGRPLIISDPEKLTYFARANAVRAGVQNMPGALSGVAVGDGEWANPFVGDSDGPGADRAFTSSEAFYSQPVLSSGNRMVPSGVSTNADGSNIETPSGGSTLDSFFNAFNRMLRGPAAQPFGPQPTVAPSPWPWVIGAGAVGLGLLVLAKRRRRA